jgi:hypothetical protein
MKKLFFAMAVVCLFAFGAFAQKAPNFSGTWTLDVSKSKLGDRNNIESQTLTVTQSDKDIKYETATKRTAPPAGSGGGGGMGGGGGRGGDMPATFTLDGKDIKMDMPGPGGTTSPATMNGKWDGSKLVLTTVRSFTNPQTGEAITSTTKQTWELGADGKSLTITSDSTSPRGTNSSTRVFTKS